MLDYQTVLLTTLLQPIENKRKFKLLNFVNNYYLEQVEPHKCGGLEIFTTKKRVWIGLGICLLLAIATEVTYLIMPTPFDFLIENFSWLGILILVGVLFQLVVVPYYEIYNSYYELAPEKLVAIQGLLVALKRQDQFIPYDFIRGCRIEQTIFGRIFNYGDLLIGTSMTGGIELTIPNIDKPQDIMADLEAMLNNKYQFVDFTRHSL